MDKDINVVVYLCKLGLSVSSSGIENPMRIKFFHTFNYSYSIFLLYFARLITSIVIMSNFLITAMTYRMLNEDSRVRIVIMEIGVIVKIVVYLKTSRKQCLWW